MEAETISSSLRQYMNTSIATQNIKLMLEKLDIDLYTHVVDNEVADSILRLSLLGVLDA